VAISIFSHTSFCLFALVSFAVSHVHTRACTPTLMHTPWILHTKGLSARGMSSNQRHDRLNLALANYILDTLFLVAQLVPSRLRLSSYFSLLFFTRADPHNRTGDTRAFTNCTHNSHTCGHRGAQCILECAVFSFKNKCWGYGHYRYEIVQCISKVDEQWDVV